jgi:assimilatory nitrate reductase electron transfer subunit
VAADPTSLPAAAVICRCNSVTKGALTQAWQNGHRSTTALAGATRATTGCGGCRAAVEGICGWLHTVDPDRHLAAIAG